jgi:hypothetical protein
VYVWVVLDLIPETQNNIYTALVLTSWAIVEVPRYLYYGWALHAAVPYIVFWMRYRYWGSKALLHYFLLMDVVFMCC